MWNLCYEQLLLCIMSRQERMMTSLFFTAEKKTMMSSCALDYVGKLISSSDFHFKL